MIWFGISHWCCWSPVMLSKKARVPSSNPDCFGIFRPEKAQIQPRTAYPGIDTPKTHRHGLSRHRHTQATPTQPIQAQTHPRHTDMAYPGTDTPKTHRHGLSRHRHTQDTLPRPTDAEIIPEWLYWRISCRMFSLNPSAI